MVFFVDVACTHLKHILLKHFRLTLNCTPAYVKPHLVNDLPVTVIDVWDSCALSQQVRQTFFKKGKGTNVQQEHVHSPMVY